MALFYMSTWTTYLLILFLILHVATAIILYKIYKKINTKIIEQKRAANEAGKALTDALRVAFDNIKQLNQKQTQASNSIKTINEKIQSILFGKKAKESEQVARFRAAIESVKKQPLSRIEENENE